MVASPSQKKLLELAAYMALSHAFVQYRSSFVFDLLLYSSTLCTSDIQLIPYVC
jgi:hypothetical protein